MHLHRVFIILAIIVATTSADKILPSNECEKDDGPGHCTLNCLLLPTYQYGLCESDKKCHCKATSIEPKPEDLALALSKCDDKNKEADRKCSMQCIYGGYSRGYCKGQTCHCQEKLD